MPETSGRSEFEQEISAALRAQKPARTASCLTPEELLSVIDRGEDDPGVASFWGHIVTCDYCRREYVELRADLLEAQEHHNPAPVPTVPATGAAGAAASPSPAVPQESGERQDGVRPSAWTRFRDKFAWPALGAGIGMAVATAATYLVAVLPWQHQLAALGDLQRRQERQYEIKVANLSTQSQQKIAAARADAKKARDELRRVQTSVPPSNIAATLDAIARNVPSRTPEDWTVSRSGVASEEGPKRIRLLAPIGVIQGTGPTFSWQPVSDPDIERQELTVTSDSKYSDLAFPVVKNIRPHDSTYQAPPEKLLPGQRYRWQVRAYRAGRRDAVALGEGKFEVLDPKSKTAAALGPLAGVHLKVGDIYAKAGLLEAARREYEAVPESQKTLFTAAQAKLKALQKRMPPPVETQRPR
jgi:hypothetical protein